MGENKGPSRIALVAVLIIVAALVAWLLWPRLSGNDDAGLTPESTAVAAVKKDTPEPEETPDPVKEVVKPVNQDVSAGDFRKDGTLYASVRDDQFFTTTSVDSLMPDTATSVFAPGEQVYVYAALHAPKSEKVHFKWFDTGGQPIIPTAYVDVEANTGPTGYRIYSYRTFRLPGEYSVKLYNELGEEIASQGFTIQ